MKKSQPVTLSILRYDSSSGGLPRYASYTVTPKNHETLLDTLETVKEKFDASLGYRRSCRHGICGSCAVRVNGMPVLACKTGTLDLVRQFGAELIVDPVDKRRVVRDLIIDMDDFWDKYTGIQPYLVEIDEPPAPEGLLIGPDQADGMGNAELCIQCGACYAVCPVIGVNGRFYGPAALTKAYRFVSDVRDFSARRLFVANSPVTGVWDCAKCLLCIEACPKEINPFEKITRLHELAMNRKLSENHEGSRHVRVFRNQVRSRGYINEFFLALFTLRAKMSEIIPRGIRLFIKGKLHINYLFPRTVKRFELRNIFRGSRR